MNNPTAYKMIAFATTRKKKIALLNFTTREGRTIKSVLNEALDQVLGVDERLLTKPKKRMARK